MAPHRLSALVYIVIDYETFQQIFVNKTIQDNLKISIHAVMIAHQSDISLTQYQPQG